MEDHGELLTQLRSIISPYLPPPVLNLIHNIDTNAQINQFIQHEPSMKILVASLALYILYITTSSLFSFEGKRKAVKGLVDDEPEGHVLSNLSNDKLYQDSVILFGPCQSGKSVLFNTLVHGEKVETVTSLKANVEVMDGVRIVDYPGHITLSAKLPSLMIPDANGKKSSGAIRALLVIDSTKPLSEAGGILYNSILTNSLFANEWKNAKDGSFVHIMVVCNKSDATGSKNWRRVKIQLRSELEKLKKISCDSKDKKNDLEGDEGIEDTRIDLSGKIDFDDLSKNGIQNVKLSFMSLSCLNEKGMDEIRAFVKNGEVITDNSSILKSRK